MNGCQFQFPRFSAPAGPGNVTQEEWDRIFKSPEPKVRPRKPKVQPLEEFECCGCEGCGVDCGCLCS